MEYKTIQLDSFKIIGISVRTTNKDGQSQNDIGKLWNDFFQENIALTIPNKETEDIYCIYTDYENDYTGKYTTILGCRVSSTKSIPNNLVAKEVERSTYNLYTSTGKLPECVGKTWMRIWQIPDNNRAYKTDFDVYGIEAQNTDNATVLTYLSTK